MGIKRVWAVMKSGDRWEGDILVGADGIHSKVWLHALPMYCGCLTNFSSHGKALLAFNSMLFECTAVRHNSAAFD